MSKAPFSKPYSQMNRTERRQHKRWLIKERKVDLDVLRVEGKEVDKDLSAEEGMKAMAEDYNRIMGEKIWDFEKWRKE